MYHVLAKDSNGVQSARAEFRVLPPPGVNPPPGRRRRDRLPPPRPRRPWARLLVAAPRPGAGPLTV